MKFENVRSWIDFVNEASLEELSKLLNDEFSLEEYIESTGLIYVDKDTLLSIKDRIMGLEFEKRFWEETLPYIDVNSLNERLLNYLIDKNIADSILGHMPLPDRYLWKLADKMEESAITLGKRMYIGEKYTCEEFEDFLNKFIDNHWLFDSLLLIEPGHGEKNNKLIRTLFRKTQYKDLKRTVIKSVISNKIKHTEKIVIIYKYYRTMEPEYLLSIAQNPITPVEILERLTKIEKVKYANKIRCCAKDNLQSRNKNICIEKEKS